MQWLRVEGCYKTISVQVTLQGWRHPCITKRAHKQCGNSILKSSTATSSGSFHHCYITPKKNLWSRRVASSGSLLELLRVQFLLLHRAESQPFLFLSRFSNSSGFFPPSAHPATAVCTCSQRCCVPDVISQSCGQGSALSPGHVGHSTHPGQVPRAPHLPAIELCHARVLQTMTVVFSLVIFLVGKPWSTARLQVMFLSPADRCRKEYKV